jgi:hypothetical protein
VTDEEFVQLYPQTSNAQLMQRLGCSRSTLQCRARRLGVRKAPEVWAAAQAARQRGRKHSTETRAKIAEKARNRNIDPATTAKRVASLKASGKNRGSSHYRWKGGKPWLRFSDPQYLAWRGAVLERDSYTCRDCDRRCARYEKGLAAHHLQSYAEHPDLRFDVDNGVTLCRGCHMARHGRAPAPKDKVACACGCGGLLDPMDRYGRPRRYINHHHRRRSP